MFSVFNTSENVLTSCCNSSMHFVLFSTCFFMVFNWRDISNVNSLLKMTPCLRHYCESSKRCIWKDVIPVRLKQTPTCYNGWSFYHEVPQEFFQPNITYLTSANQVLMRKINLLTLFSSIFICLSFFRISFSILLVWNYNCKSSQNTVTTFILS